METAKTFLRTHELVRAIKPLVLNPVSPKDIFRLIGDGTIEPCGYIQRVPVFDIAQIGVIAKEVRSIQGGKIEKRSKSPGGKNNG